MGVVNPPPVKQMSTTTLLVLVHLQDEAAAYQAAFKRSPPREVIVFILGGSTFEEARAVAEWNDRNPHMRVILGGSAVLNSDAFLTALGGGA